MDDKVLVWDKEVALADSFGWGAILDHDRGPDGWCKFFRVGELIWSAYPNWIRAGIGADGVYREHDKYPSLIEALVGKIDLDG